ncbi:MAG: gamma carbonic anhydrase family protein [Termitinemataceae bacterium]
MVHAITDLTPKLDPSVFVAWNAEVAGAVVLEKDVSVWFSATLRADIAPIYIGSGSNVQDGAVIHVDTDVPTRVGKRVTVGHGAILHSCTIGDDVIVGMGAIVLNGAVIGEESIIGAGALITQGKQFPPRSLILGSPAKAVRELTEDEITSIRQNAEQYIKLGRSARDSYIE